MRRELALRARKVAAAPRCGMGKVLGLGSGLVLVLATGAHCANCCSLTSLALGVTMGV